MPNDSLNNKLSQIFENKLVDEILNLAEVIQVKEGDVIMDYGKKVRFLPIIINGTIRVMRKDEE